MCCLRLLVGSERSEHLDNSAGSPRLSHNDDSSRNGRWTVSQRHPLVVPLNPSLGVIRKDLRQRSTEFQPEINHAPELPPELLPDCRPRDELWLVLWHPVQPLGEPGVNIQGHGRMRERGQCPLVERHRVLCQAVEVAVVQVQSLDQQGREPTFEYIHELTVDLHRMTISCHGHAKNGNGKSRANWSLKARIS